MRVDSPAVARLDACTRATTHPQKPHPRKLSDLCLLARRRGSYDRSTRDFAADCVEPRGICSLQERSGKQMLLIPQFRAERIFLPHVDMLKRSRAKLRWYSTIAPSGPCMYANPPERAGSMPVFLGSSIWARVRPRIPPVPGHVSLPLPPQDIALSRTDVWTDQCAARLGIWLLDEPFARIERCAWDWNMKLHACHGCRLL